jgi:hypothetical protein
LWRGHPRSELLSDLGLDEFAAGIDERCDGRIAPHSDSRNFSQAYSAAPNRCFRREALAPAAFHA